MPSSRRSVLSIMAAISILALSATGAAAKPSGAGSSTTTLSGPATCDLKVALRLGPLTDDFLVAPVGNELEFYGFGFQPNTEVDVLFGRPATDGQSFVVTVTTDDVGDFFFILYFEPGEEGQWTVRAPEVAPVPGCSGSDEVEVSVETRHRFTDISGHPFESEITWLFQRGITLSGCAHTLYCPNDVVTREQMASFLVRALYLPQTSTDFFTDDETSVHEPDINRLAGSGITTGCTATRFCPGQPVTRQEMASFLVRGLGLPQTTADFFTDDETSIHESDINRLAASGITTGCTTTQFCPTATVTRGQMAAFLERALFGTP